MESRCHEIVRRLGPELGVGDIHYDVVRAIRAGAIDGRPTRGDYEDADIRGGVHDLQRAESTRCLLHSVASVARIFASAASRSGTSDGSGRSLSLGGGLVVTCPA